jgi:hypothetical protein
VQGTPTRFFMVEGVAASLRADAVLHPPATVPLAAAQLI